MIIRSNTASKEFTKEAVPEGYRMLGGRSLTSRLVLDEVDALCEHLGKKNKLVLAPGLLGGTSAPCSGRISIGAKSPLTGGIKESNSGGTAGQKLAKLGIKALVLENQPQTDKWHSLLVTKSGVKFLDADKVAGKGNYETAAYYRNEFGKSCAVVSIGPAGEDRLAASTIAVTDRDGIPARQCARGGLGAVMGSKKIKAIIIDDSGAQGVKIFNPEEYRKIAVEWSKILIETKKGLSIYGTANLVDTSNKLGCMPTRNFSSGSFEDAALINAHKLKELLEKRGGKSGHACHPGCVIRCSNVFNDADGNYVTSSLEYETIVLMGANLGINDLDAIARMDRFCDDMGLDTMEMGVTLGVVMEAGLIPFGDGEKAFGLLGEIKQKTALGLTLGQGAAVTGKALGVKRIPTVKNQGIAAYDPRALKGTGVTYATSPQGADHTAGNVLPGRGGYRPHTITPMDVQKGEGQADFSKDMQVLTSVCDISGQCFFVGATVDTAKYVAQLLNAMHGLDMTYEDVLKLSIDQIKTELEFNRRAGFTKEDDKLPEFFFTESLPPHDLVFDVPDDEVNTIWSEWNE